MYIGLHIVFGPNSHIFTLPLLHHRNLLSTFLSSSSHLSLLPHQLPLSTWFHLFLLTPLLFHMYYSHHLIQHLHHHGPHLHLLLLFLSTIVVVLVFLLLFVFFVLIQGGVYFHSFSSVSFFWGNSASTLLPWCSCSKWRCWAQASSYCWNCTNSSHFLFCAPSFLGWSCIYCCLPHQSSTIISSSG